MRFAFEIVGITRSQVRQQLNLQPINPTNLSSFATSSLYNLKELIAACDPAILGAMPEQSIYVYALEILENITSLGNLPDVSQYHVIVPEIPKNNEFVPANARVVFQQALALIVARIIEVQVVLPDTASLESARNYCPNGLAIGLTVNLVDPLETDPASKETRPSIPFPVWLPLPYLGVKMDWDESGSAVGFPELPPGAHSVDIANYLGIKAVPRDTHPIPTPAELVRCTDTPGGQLRWYSLDQGAMTLQKMLGIGSATNPNQYPSAPQGQLALVLPDEAERKLGELRRAGRWLYNECDVWTDDNFHVRLPKEAGYLVAWRDDLPSRPIQCFDPQKYLHDLLVTLAKKLWGTAGTRSDIEVRIPIPIGQVINLAVQRLQDAVNNELVNLIGTTGLNIRFAFLTSPYTNADNPASCFDESHFCLPDGADESLLRSIGSSLNSLVFRDAFEPGQGGQTLDLRYQPHVIQDGDQDSGWSAFAVQLQVYISGTVAFHDIKIDLNDVPPMAVGPRLVFTPEPVRLPTLAIFFCEEYFRGTPLVMLPANSGLFDQDIYFDANSTGDPNEFRNPIVAKLNDLYNLLKLVQIFWSNESFNMILNILGEVVSIGRMVVCTKGRIDDLSKCIAEKRWPWDASYNDQISSMVMIGPPHKWTGTQIKCYQHNASSGLCLRLMLSGDLFVAAIPSFRFLLVKYTFKNPVRGEPDITVELPYGDPPNNTPSTGVVNFNDVVSGIEFVNEP